jgi:hypothetical protein
MVLRETHDAIAHCSAVLIACKSNDSVRWPPQLAASSIFFVCATPNENSNMGLGRIIAPQPKGQLGHSAVAMPLNEAFQAGGISRPSLSQSKAMRSAISSETSRDQPSTVLNETTRTGLEYWPSIRSVTTVARSVRSSSGSRHDRPMRSPKSSSPNRFRAHRGLAQWKALDALLNSKLPKPKRIGANLVPYGVSHHSFWLSQFLPEIFDGQKHSRNDRAR